MARALFPRFSRVAAAISVLATCSLLAPSAGAAPPANLIPASDPVAAALAAAYRAYSENPVSERLQFTVRSGSAAPRRAFVTISLAPFPAAPAPPSGPASPASPAPTPPPSPPFAALLPPRLQVRLELGRLSLWASASEVIALHRAAPDRCLDTRRLAELAPLPVPAAEPALPSAPTPSSQSAPSSASSPPAAAPVPSPQTVANPAASRTANSPLSSASFATLATSLTRALRGPFPALALAADPSFAHPLGILTPAPVRWRSATAAELNASEGLILHSLPPSTPSPALPALRVTLDPKTSRLRTLTAEWASNPPLTLEIKVIPVAPPASLSPPETRPRRPVLTLDELVPAAPAVRAGVPLPRIQLVSPDFVQVAASAVLFPEAPPAPASPAIASPARAVIFHWARPADPDAAQLADDQARAAFIRLRKALDQASAASQQPALAPLVIVRLEFEDTDPPAIAALAQRWSRFVPADQFLWTTDSAWSASDLLGTLPAPAALVITTPDLVQSVVVLDEAPDEAARLRSALSAAPANPPAFPAAAESPPAP